MHEYTTVAVELCNLSRVTGPEFPPPLLSSRTLCLPGFCTMCWKVLVNPTFSPESTCWKVCYSSLIRGPCAEKCWSTPPLESTCWKVCCSSLRGPGAEKCYSTPTPWVYMLKKCVALPLVTRDLCCKVQARMLVIRRLVLQSASVS